MPSPSSTSARTSSNGATCERRHPHRPTDLARGARAVPRYGRRVRRIPRQPRADGGRRDDPPGRCRPCPGLDRRLRAAARTRRWAPAPDHRRRLDRPPRPTRTGAGLDPLLRAGDCRPGLAGRAVHMAAAAAARRSGERDARAAAHRPRRAQRRRGGRRCNSPARRRDRRRPRVLGRSVPAAARHTASPRPPSDRRRDRRPASARSERPYRRPGDQWTTRPSVDGRPIPGGPRHVGTGRRSGNRARRADRARRAAPDRASRTRDRACATPSRRRPRSG